MERFKAVMPTKPVVGNMENKKRDMIKIIRTGEKIGKGTDKIKEIGIRKRMRKGKARN